MSRPHPRVSVIIPCYRGEAFITGAITSVLDEGEGLEVVVVDDASPDAVVARVESLKDARVRVIRHPVNRGIGAARNTGLAEARAPVVAFLDQDDLWLPGRVVAQLEVLDALRSEGVGLVFGDSLVREDTGRQWTVRASLPYDAYRLSAGEVLSRLITGRFPPLGSVFVLRDAVADAGGFNEAMRGGADDFDIMVRLAERCRFAGVGRAVYVRRLHESNYTSARRMSGEAISVIDGVEQRHPALHRAACGGRSQHYYRRATESQLAGDRARAASDYRLALRNRAWSPRAWLGLLLCALGPAGDVLARRWIRARGGRVPEA